MSLFSCGFCVYVCLRACAEVRRQPWLPVFTSPLAGDQLSLQMLPYKPGGVSCLYIPFCGGSPGIIDPGTTESRFHISSRDLNSGHQV